MQQFLKDLQTSLKGEYSESEIHVLGMLILEKLTGFSRIWLLIHKELKLNDEQNIIASQYLERLKNHEPIQYILGETEFYGLKFKVNPSVLIPRPETEELVEWVKPPHPPKGGFLSGTPTLLDVGTGSGCIAVALKKKYPSATVSAIDISAEALKVASENAALNQVDVDIFSKRIG